MGNPPMISLAGYHALTRKRDGSLIEGSMYAYVSLHDALRNPYIGCLKPVKADDHPYTPTKQSLTMHIYRSPLKLHMSHGQDCLSPLKDTGK